MPNRRLTSTRTPKGARGAEIQIEELRLQPRTVFTLKTTGSPADLGVIDMTGGDSSLTPAYIVKGVQIGILTAAGTVAATTIGIYTAAAAGGTTVVTAAALTAMTAASKSIAMTVATSDILVAPKLYVRQTVDSANAGTIVVIVDRIDATTED